MKIIKNKKNRVYIRASERKYVYKELEDFGKWDGCIEGFLSVGKIQNGRFYITLELKGNLM